MSLTLKILKIFRNRDLIPHSALRLSLHHHTLIMLGVPNIIIYISIRLINLIMLNSDFKNQWFLKKWEFFFVSSVIYFEHWHSRRRTQIQTKTELSKLTQLHYQKICRLIIGTLNSGSQLWGVDCEKIENWKNWTTSNPAPTRSQAYFEHRNHRYITENVRTDRKNGQKTKNEKIIIIYIN